MSKLDIPSLDILEEYLRRGYYIDFQDDSNILLHPDGNHAEDEQCILFDAMGEGFVVGQTLREMLVNLIMADGCE